MSGEQVAGIKNPSNHSRLLGAYVETGCRKNVTFSVPLRRLSNSTAAGRKRKRPALRRAVCGFGCGDMQPPIPTFAGRGDLTRQATSHGSMWWPGCVLSLLILLPFFGRKSTIFPISFRMVPLPSLASVTRLQFGTAIASVLRGRRINYQVVPLWSALEGRSGL